jgi:hypothetical protein
MAICPNCGRAFDHAVQGDVIVRAGTSVWHGVTYSCPRCHVTLHAAIDHPPVQSTGERGQISVNEPQHRLGR